ncbi:transglycosylase SLT domain-containing protein [Granulosicoccus antarcticus]|uniref:Soluble lytic murein transglycosylase n=1 Tax=Granulosicoccus antarcticus IMCC3135 TaxID=1192854 RepID=A0A2Z2P1C7_9GAMM|nr:transglycosylase SLT domain-containing protein [Granulosicoccus antarcticus]ASJ75968.1 Soluble lytic murein transglycosylase [Granulosicoccus antarcticus IMCC3135]
MNRLARAYPGVVMMFDFKRQMAFRPVTSQRLAACLLALASVSLAASGEATAQTAGSVEAVDAVYAAEREQFTQALDALKSGQRSRFDALEVALADYPLREYLEYERLKRDWRDETPGAVQIDQLNDFEQRTGDASLTRRLTHTLQKRFADTEQWRTFLALSHSRLAAAMSCEMLQARQATGALDGFDDDVIELWVKPRKHDKDCQEILDKLQAANTPPVAAIWEKIYQAMEANKPEFAKPMLGYLATTDRKQVERWIKSGKKPQAFVLSGDLDQDTLLNRIILLDLLVDWSREDTLAAMTHWLKIRDKYAFTADGYYETHRALAMRAAYRRMPEAAAWLRSFEVREDDLELMEWRIRTSLLAQDWPAVLASIALLPPEERQEDHWAYWEARALGQLDRVSEAQAIYTKLADLQSYYGFLSADKMQLEYSIYDEPIIPGVSLLARLSAEPALVRAREFHHVDLTNESRREWNNWLRGKTSEELATAAVLASSWGMHDRAIYAAGLSDSPRAIALRFPVLYRSDVARASMEHSIEPAWIFGVMRRESAYIRDVRSGAGAVGLMQLMPATAKYVAGLQGKRNWKGDLTDSATNIGFGTYYLRHVMNKFNDHQVLATASYNAGPSRVDQWLRDSSIEADIWIDTIPFTETRRYVRAVLAYAAIYDYHLRGTAQRLSEKLRPIPAAASGV